MSISPLLISLRTAAFSIVFTFFLGILSAWAVWSMRSVRARAVLDGLLSLPMILPPSVAGFFLLMIFGVKHPIGKMLLDFFAVRIVFNWPATVLAASVISFPLMYRAARGAFEQVDENLAYAARTLGMRESALFFKVILPTAVPGVTAGAVLAFARGLGEFGATIMIAGNIEGKTRTLPMAVYSAVNAADMDLAFRYVLILLVTSLAILIAMNAASGLATSKQRRNAPSHSKRESTKQSDVSR